jgi:NAD(P)-dependent dehydrogenase (short-subunit alcohol dehydrogenase family)
VIVASRNQEGLTRSIDTWCRAGLDVYAELLDLSSTDSIQGLNKRVADRYGGVDFLVNNAVARLLKDWTGPAEAFEQSMCVNATALFEMTRIFAERMKDRGRGSIINVGSIPGMVRPDFALYDGPSMSALPDYLSTKVA